MSTGTLECNVKIFTREKRSYTIDISHAIDCCLFKKRLWLLLPDVLASITREALASLSAVLTSSWSFQGCPSGRGTSCISPGACRLCNHLGPVDYLLGSLDNERAAGRMIGKAI
jgi:hypothetical protein